MPINVYVVVPGAGDPLGKTGSIALAGLIRWR